MTNDELQAMRKDYLERTIKAHWFARGFLVGWFASGMLLFAMHFAGAF